MKDAEDEAFDELAKRQGDWGSGFQAKRQMAADKLQDESDMLTIAYLHGYEKGKRASLAQPAQEPDYWLGYGLQAHTEKPFENATALYTTPPKREWVGLTDKEVFETMAESMNSKVLNQKVYEAIEAKLRSKNNG